MVIFENILWYIGVIGTVHGLAIAVGSIILQIARRFRRPHQHWRAVRAWLVFNSAMCIAGTAACGTWTALAWNRWYVGMDPVVIYQPFIPFGQWVLDVRFGTTTGYLLNGASMFRLQLLWLVLTFGVWGFATVVTKRIFRRRVA